MQMDVYADGGVVKKNPSRIGGTYGYVLVGETHTTEGAGWLYPVDVGTEAVGNNQSEFYAVLTGVEQAWRLGASEVRVLTDSHLTIRRWRDGAGLAGISREWQVRMQKVLRSVKVTEYVLLDGHPTKAQLRSGKGKRGNPVSIYNVTADRLCAQAAVRMADRHESMIEFARSAILAAGAS